MKKNNIETAREFLDIVLARPEYTDTYDILVQYATYLTAPDSDGEKSAEEILGNITGRTFEKEKYYDQEDALKAMHEFAAQSRKELSDEEIEIEVFSNVASGHKNNTVLFRDGIRYGAKWARSKMTGK